MSYSSDKYATGGDTASDDIHWMAFQYLADELDDDQTRWFESLLAEDQSAREALAAAVEITDTVVATASVVEIPANRSGRRVQSLGWITVGAALCLAVMLTARWIAQPARPEPTVQQQTIDAASMAIAWEQTRAMLADQTELPPIPMLEDEEDFSELTGDVIEDQPETPSWMESALLGMSEDEEEEEEWEG